MIMTFRRHIANFSAFTAIQIASYLIPIVTVPYFARVLTIEGIGQVAIAGAVAMAGSVVMDYGINLSGIRFAAKSVDDTSGLSRYFSTTSALKVSIFIALSLLFLISTPFVPNVADHFSIYFWSIVSAGCLTLFPQWLYQGLLMVPAAARILVTTRVLAAASALLLVRHPTDAYLVPMTQGIGNLIALLAAVSALRQKMRIRLVRPHRSELKQLLRDNAKLFTATAWGGVHTHGSIVIMGALLSANSVGLYSIAQRIAQAFVSVFNIAAQSVFPVFVRSYARQSISFGRQTTYYVGIAAGVAFICLCVMFFLREPIYAFFSGQRSELGVTIFSIWLFASFFTVISVSLNPIMVAMNFDSRMASVYRLTGLAFLICAPIGSIYLDAVGVALATLIPECFMALYCLKVVTSSNRRQALDRGE